MGHRNSKAFTEAIKKLSSLELQNIKAVFNELSTENQDGTREIPEPNLATRRVFAERFCLPGLIGERLFHAFDRDNNGTINLEEFVGGVALCLHGSAQAKCELLFRIFNFSDDEDAVSEDELKTVLLSSLQSANTILVSVQGNGVAELKEGDKPLVETVAEIVEDAFRTCDKSKNGKLSAKEFSAWLHKNPRIMDNVFGWQCPKPELGQWANEAEAETSVVAGQQAGGKSLQDLFGGSQGSVDLSGETFFDSLGTAVDPVVAVRETTVGETTVEEKIIEDLEQSGNAPIVEGSTPQMTIVNDNDVSEEELKISSPLSPDALSSSPPPSSPVQFTPSTTIEPSLETETAFTTAFDYHVAMWLPSDETNSFLQAIKNGTVKPENVKLSNLPVPCLAIDSPQVDPVKELISKFLTEGQDSTRSMPTEDTVSCDESGLKDLLRAECWTAALNLTTKLLAGTNHQNVSQVVHSPKSLEIWFCRIALLFQLKMFSVAEIELEAFGNLDSAKLYYNFQPELHPERHGSMVPFCFRILDAMLPQHTGRSKESLDKLFYIHSVCVQILKGFLNRKFEEVSQDNVEEQQKGIELWEERLVQVLYCIGNTFVLLKEYGLAISVFKQIAKKDVDNSKALLSGIGRISLQSGDIESAQFYFKAVEDMSSSEGTAHQPDVLINWGLLALTLDAYEEAYKHFSAAKTIDPENSVAINNAAVSLLFQGRLKEALNLLEDIVFAHPEKNLQEGILFNICTMYELETSHHLKKKQHLLGLIAKHRGDGFNVSSLKFP